jgi:site-specific recombinase XerD
MSLLRHLVGGRTAGVLVLRPRFRDDDPPLLTNMDRSQMAGALLERLATRQAELKRALTRAEHARLAVTVWRDAGAVKPTVLRVAFMKVTRQIGLPRVTCPKSWRHTFATTMQEAGVDPLIRQETMGHVPAGAGRSALGMTATYTHTQLEVHRQQLQRVIDLRPKTTEILNRRLSPDKEN